MNEHQDTTPGTYVLVRTIQTGSVTREYVGMGGTYPSRKLVESGEATASPTDMDTTRAWYRLVGMVGEFARSGSADAVKVYEQMQRLRPSTPAWERHPVEADNIDDAVQLMKTHNAYESGACSCGVPVTSLAEWDSHRAAVSA